MSTDITYNEDEIVKEFHQKLEQIAVKWLSIWSTLTKQEKCIVTMISDRRSLKWSELVDEVDFSQRTLANYLSKLKNKGIISHSKKEYKIDDHMLSAWLKYRKEEDGFYPQ
ncbi:MAG: ArsR family transcriptional regulator [Methanobacterium sp. ERen5]|nr:MAG: ArsR family transcriptional regulator [Methanobacterium sp. ERen5]